MADEELTKGQLAAIIVFCATWLLLLFWFPGLSG